MVITWYGETCFRLQSGEVTLMTDAPAASSGLKQPRFKYDILIKSLTSVPVTKPQDDAFVIVGPGEYEIKKMTVRGFALPEDSTEDYLKSAYIINDGEITICYLGHVSNPELPAKLMESLDEIDVLILPGGGEPFLAQEHAVKVANQIEPSIIIPSNFKVPDLSRKADDVKKFLQEIGSQAKPQEKLTVKKRDLSAEGTTVEVLKPSI